MSDYLTYRLPDSQEIVRSAGSFSLVGNGEEATGFTITDFLHQNIWHFTGSDESAENPGFHSQTTGPAVISRRDYQIEAQAMLNAFRVCGVEKAVYSRVKALSFPLENALKLFCDLEKNYPKAFVYLISSDKFGTWTGATPEVLLDVEGNQLKTVALAGTHPAGDQAEWTEKEFEEHEFVAEAVESTLVRNKCEIIDRNGPFVVSAGPVQHLKTTFLADLDSVSPWKIAMDLHPTPAVCGTPRMAALDLLSSREMHERQLYTGIIGIQTRAKTQLFVNLRCAQLQKEKAFLYVGGGYTKDSIPDLEWEETENKAKTLGMFMNA